MYIYIYICIYTNKHSCVDIHIQIYTELFMDLHVYILMLFAWESTGLFFSAKAEVARHRRRRVQSHAGDSGVKYVPKIINRGTGKIPMNGGFGFKWKLFMFD